MAAPTPWKPTVRTVANGQPVDEAVTNRGTSDLQRRTEHLKERLDAMVAGQALVCIEQPMASSLAAGSPAYLDNDLVWKPGRAALDSDAYGVPTGLAKASFIEGIVLYKDSATMGGVVLYGHVEFTSEILSVLQGSYVAGPLYLSTTEGLLTCVRPTVPVGVGVVRGPDANGVYHVFVNPENKSVLEDHVHYRIALTWQPAGTVNCLTGLDPTERYVVIPDSSQPGWLPADDPAFALMTKPAGAKFGYNIALDATLNGLWPPIPLSSVFVDLDGQAVVESGRLVANEYNLWWMDDCYGGAPWTDFWACENSSSSAGSSSSGALTACFVPERAMTLWMVRMVYKTSDAAVSSLEPINDTIELLNCSGLPATTGRLRIRAKFSTTQETGSYSPYALKAFDPELLKFTSGIVCGRIRSLSSNIVVSGTAAGTGWKAGDVSLDFIDPNSQREGQPSLISLKNVREASFNDIMFLAFDENVDSHIIGKIDMGQNTITAAGTLQLYFWLLARAAGVLPAMTLTAITMAMPAGCTPQAFPTGAWDPVVLGSCGSALAANQYVRAESDPIAVNPGDLIYFKLARSSSDAYAGVVGVPSIRYVITV